VPQSVKHPTLDLPSGLEFKPHAGLHAGRGAYLKKKKRKKERKEKKAHVVF